MVGTRKASDLPLVPESVLKRRHDLDDLKRKRQAANETYSNNGRSSKKTAYIKKPETFLSQSRNRRNNATRYRRVMRKGMQKRASSKKEIKDVVIADETSSTLQSNSVDALMVFVIRIRDDVGVPRVCKRALKRLRLHTIHTGVFVRYNDVARKRLHLVEPFVVYGIPSKAIVTDLLERKGHALIDNERVPISDNLVIEKVLGEEHNIICIEDLVHELYSVGDSFNAASNFLAPFSLADTKTDFERRTLKLKDGKDYGDRGELVNQYIKEAL